MFSRSVVVALTSVAAIACGGSELLSSPSTWGGDFTDRSPPTDECPGGTLPSFAPAWLFQIHSRLGRAFLSLFALVLWRVTGSILFNSARTQTQATSGGSAATWSPAVIASSTQRPLAMTTEQPPNNSFKPNPLRGSA